MSFVTLFLARLYISMWTTRPVFCFFRSARLLACFALMAASFIQGELGRLGTTFSFSGAWKRWLSNISSEQWSVNAFNISAFHHLAGNPGPQEVSSDRKQEVIRHVQVINIDRSYKHSSSLWPFTYVGSVTNWSKPSGLYNWTKCRVSGSLDWTCSLCKGCHEK